MIENLTVPVLNRYDLLNRMLSSIDYPVRDLLIIDNGGCYEDLFGRPELETVESVWILTMPSNLGVAASWNLGIKLFPHDRRWFFASNDMWFQPGGMATLSEAVEGSLTLSDSFPHFHTFAVGEAVVEAVGLFDERYYPAFFEDNDLMARVMDAGIPVERLPIAAGHNNSSTLKSDPNYQRRNAETFLANRDFFRRKMKGDVSHWSWELDRRRAGEWGR